MKDIKVVLEFERSTKGTHLYATRGTTAAVTSIYIKKHGMPDTPPAAIVVTISINGSDDNGK